MSTATPNPMANLLTSHLFTKLCQNFPNLTQQLQELQTSESELQTLSQSEPVDTHLSLTLKLASIRFQILSAKFSDAALTALASLLTCEKPEVVRRSAMHILTLSGLLPPKPTSPKPWLLPQKSGIGVPPMGGPNHQNPTQEIVITKQHPPTYSNPSAETPNAGCHTQWGRSPAGHALREDTQPTSTPQHPHQKSEFSLQNSTLKTAITKQHLPTYNDLNTPDPSPRAGTPASRRPVAETPVQSTPTPQRHPTPPATSSVPPTQFHHLLQQAHPPISPASIAITKPHLPTYNNFQFQPLLPAALYSSVIPFSSYMHKYLAAQLAFTT